MLASMLNKKISCQGFDFIKIFNQILLVKNFKYPHSKNKLFELLSPLKNVDENLVKGNTLETLKEFINKIKFDFVFWMWAIQYKQ